MPGGGSGGCVGAVTCTLVLELSAPIGTFTLSPTANSTRDSLLESTTSSSRDSALRESGDEVGLLLGRVATSLLSFSTEM